MRKGTGEIGAIKRVNAVGGTDAVARMNAYRAGLSARDWGIAQRERIDGGAPAAKPGPTSAAPKPPVSPPPPPPSEKELLVVPLQVTLSKTSQRDWREVKRLISKLNEIFEPARLSFQLTDPAETDALPGGDSGCPFAQELDHEYEWLHLALVPQLPQDAPILPSCGRCCLVSDRCDDRRLAQAMCQLLGLGDGLGVTAGNGLMNYGSGLALNGGEISWLRWHAGSMLGHRMNLKPFTVPLWSYQVESPECYRTGRTEGELRQLLEHVNVIYQQAGVRFELANWCHLQEHELGLEAWQKIMGESLQKSGIHLAPLVQYGGRALHVFFLNFPQATHGMCLDPQRSLCVMNDSLQVGRARVLAHSFGSLLGLKQVPGTDQLMCRTSQGFRLSPQEITLVRGKAVDKIYCSPPKESGAAGPRPAAATDQAPRAEVPLDLDPPRIVSLKVHLVRGSRTASKQSRAQATQWIEDVNRVWEQANVRLQVSAYSEAVVSDGVLEDAYPNVGGVATQRKPSCAGLLKSAAYDKNVLNLYVLHELPALGQGRQVSSHIFWKDAKVLMVGEKFHLHSLTKQLALSLAVMWGLKWQKGGHFYRLTSWQASGTKLTVEEITQVRAALAPPEVVPHAPLPQLLLPLKIHLVRNEGNGFPLKDEEALAALARVNEMFKVAAIRLEVKACNRVDVPDEALEVAYPNAASVVTDRKASCDRLAEIAGYDPHSLNLYWVDTVRSFTGGVVAHSASWKSRRLILGGVKHYKDSLPKVLGRAVASFLGLISRTTTPPECLVTYHSEGTALLPDEIKTLRAQATKVKAALDPVGSTTVLPELILVLRLHVVRNRNHGSLLTLEQVRQMLEEVKGIWSTARIRLQVSVCQEIEVDDATLENAFPSEKGDTQRVKDFSGLPRVPGYDESAYNLFLLRHVHSIGATNAKDGFISTSNAATRVFLVAEKDSTWSSAKCVARGQAVAVGLAVNEFDGPDRLMGSATGISLGATDIERLRAEVVRLFPPKPTVSLALASAPELIVPVKLHLVGGARSSAKAGEDEARNYFKLVSEIWEQARIRPLLAGLSRVEFSDVELEPTFPNAPGTSTTRTPDCGSLTRIAEYDPEAFNLFLLSQLPMLGKANVFGYYQLYRKSRLALVSERDSVVSTGTLMACVLGLLSGLTLSTESKSELLMKIDTKGTYLTAGEIDKARVQVALDFPQQESRASEDVTPESSLDTPDEDLLLPEPRLALPIKLRLVRQAGNSSTWSEEKALAWVDRVNRIWRRANIELKVVACEETPIPEAALEEAYPNAPGVITTRTPFCFGLMRVPGNEPGALNVLVVHRLPLRGSPQSGSFVNYPLSKMLLVAETGPISAEKCLAAALAHMLGMCWKSDAPEAHLSHPNSSGVGFTEDEIGQVRAGLLRLFPVSALAFP